MAGSSPKKIAGVQAFYCPVRELGPNYFSLYVPSAPGERELRGVLEVSGLNYLLKSEEEQRLVNDVFQTVLASLSYPLQVLMRVVPLDLEGYLRTFQVPVRVGAPNSTPSLWQQHAAGYVQFLRDLATRQTLLERNFYVIVPAHDAPIEDSGSLLSRILLSGRMRSARQVEAELSHAKQQLDLRCADLTRQLSAMGLSVRRLGGQELAQLEYSCYSPRRAQEYPLQPDWLEGIDRLTRRGDLVGEKPQESERARPELDWEAERRATKKKKGRDAEEVFRWPDLADLISPTGIRLAADSLYMEKDYVQVLDVHALPRQVAAGWFCQLATIGEPLELSLFYAPLPAAKTMQQLRRKRFEMSTSSALGQDIGRYDPEVLIAQNDIEGLMDRIASGQDRMLEFSMHILVRGASKRELEDRVARVRAVLHSMLLGVRPAIFEMDKGFRSCLPYCQNELRTGEYPIALASRELATTFPFLSHTLIMQSGILEGITLNDEPVILDWWAKSFRNANRLIVGPSGSGKSFKTKLDIIRSFLLYHAKALWERQESVGLPFQTLIVDIEREYLRPTKLLGGQWIRFAPGSLHQINPFDLPRTHPNSSQRFIGEDSLSDKVSKLQALLDVMLAEQEPGSGVRRLSNLEKGLLDKAIYETYKRAGITSDPQTHDQTPPLMQDLYQVLLSEVCGPDTTGLASRLQRYVTGSLAGTFAGQTNVVLNAPVVCFDIHDLPKDLRPVALFLISEHVWTVSFGSTIPRQFIVDELLSLYEYEEGKWFLESLFQRARKHYLSIIGITQYPKILLESTIPTNCAINVIMAQELASLPLVRDVFKLSDPEIQLVRSFGKGEGLVLCGDKRFAVRFEASEHEYYYCTSDPEDLARFEREALKEEQQGGESPSLVDLTKGARENMHARAMEVA